MNMILAVGRRYTAEIAAAVRADLFIYLVALGYLITGAVYVLGRSRPLFGRYEEYSSGCLVLCGVVLPYCIVMLGVIRIALFAKGRRALAYRHMFAPRRVGRFVAGTLLILVTLMLFEAMFTSIKTAFSSNGFAYDRLAADIDSVLHFGRAPSTWLGFLRSAWLLHLLELNYEVLWFALWIGTLYWVAISPRAEALRLRFMLTFMINWIVAGNIIASVFSTAGPALYGRATGDTARFAGLQTFLDSTTNMTADTQHYLWSLHALGQAGLGAGISAFPSMHVAITTMCALFLGERSPRLGLLGAGYTLVILVSSVYLGWHYAIDGYASVLLTVGIYWAVRWGAVALPRLRNWRPATPRPAFAPPATIGAEAEAA